MIDTSKWKMKPFQHQIDGVEKLLKNEAFFLADEMGCGKSAQIVNAACTLAEQGKIDTVVIVAPASVRCVWLDAEIGEIKKHSWNKFNVVAEFHKKLKRVWVDNEEDCGLLWIVTNYEFLRNKERLEYLCETLKGNRSLLVLDESSYIKNRTSQQTKAIAKLRQYCARCVLLNGTPVTNSPLDLFSQMNILSPKILKGENFYQFRAKYCDMQSVNFGNSRKAFMLVKGYKNLDKLARRVAPYVLRRLKADCLDLPEKLYTTREVALTPEIWRRYQELKKDAVMSLGNGETRLEPNAAVRLMRLAQLTSGILGASPDILLKHGQSPSYDPTKEEFFPSEEFSTHDLSDEKLKWCVQYLTEECTAKAVIVWTRWRRERERLYEALDKIRWHIGQDRDRPMLELYQIYGGQSKSERQAAVLCLALPYESSNLNRKTIVLAQPHAGGFGLNLVAASEAIYLSNDFALGIRLQSEDRIHRPGQINKCLYIDCLATGPKGECSIDHIIAKALREKQNLADYTTSQWKKELEND